MNYAGGRVVLALEGGYNLDTISDSAEECVKVAFHHTCFLIILLKRLCRLFEHSIRIYKMQTSD